MKYLKLFEVVEPFVRHIGVIHFDAVNMTKKHHNQADWKRIAIVMLDGDITEYYAWLIKKRYNLILNKPLRGAHITFINDSIRDIKNGLNCSEEEANEAWEALKEKWDGQEIEICLDVDARSSRQHWWLNIPQDKRTELHAIRAEIGLGRPYWGLHMSIGIASHSQLTHSNYIVDLIDKGLIS